MNAEEQLVQSGGNHELAQWMSHVRLSCPYDDEPRTFLWNVQAAFNFPILYASSALLEEFVQKKQAQRVLFCSRDCCLWLPLHRTLFPTRDSVYLWTSRECCRRGSPAFISYIDRLWNDDAVLADITGGGSAIQGMRPKTDRFVPKAFVTFLLDRPNRRAVDLSQLDVGRAVNFSELPIVDNTHFEMANYALHGQVNDVDEQGQAVMAAYEHDPALVRVAHEAMAVAIRGLPLFRLENPAMIIKRGLSMLQLHGPQLRRLFPNHGR